MATDAGNAISGKYYLAGMTDGNAKAILPTATDHVVGAGQSGVRLDVFATSVLVGVSRSRVQARIKEGDITVNGQPARASLVLSPGDAVRIAVEGPPEAAEMIPEDRALDILFEDEALLVLNKPAGISVHPGAGVQSGTLVHALLHHCRGLSSIGGVERPGIVHRLDKETSGCLVVAKSDAAHNALSDQFARRAVSKAYLAVADGTPRMPHGIIDAAIARHKVHRQKMAVDPRGREALTAYRVLGQEGAFSLVECRPKTGRTHQIRVHLKHLGHPVTGDPVYGRRRDFERHLLHAWKLEFLHPLTGRKMAFVAPLPPDFPAWTRQFAGG